MEVQQFETLTYKQAAIWKLALPFPPPSHPWGRHFSYTAVGYFVIHSNVLVQCVALMLLCDFRRVRLFDSGYLRLKLFIQNICKSLSHLILSRQNQLLPFIKTLHASLFLYQYIFEDLEL